MKAVYVLTIDYHNQNGAPVIYPEVFDSLDGAKEYAKENWGVKLQRMAQSYWTGVQPDVFTARIHKRTVFKR